MIPSSQRMNDDPEEEEPFDEKESIVSFKQSVGAVIVNPAQLKEFSSHS